MKYLWKLVLIIFWVLYLMLKIVLKIVHYIALVLWSFNFNKANIMIQETIDCKTFFYLPIKDRIFYKTYYKSIPDLWISRTWTAKK